MANEPVDPLPLECAKGTVGQIVTFSREDFLDMGEIDFYVKDKGTIYYCMEGEKSVRKPELPPFWGAKLHSNTRLHT